jgi:hypothetical protein
MSLYLVLETSWIDGKYVEEGETVEFEGLASKNLQLISETPLDVKKRKASE